MLDDINRWPTGARLAVRLRAGRAGVLVASGALALISCSSPSASPAAGEPAAPIQVFAAASLTDAMADLATAFEAEHPTFVVLTNHGASSALQAQLLDGASADVVAVADPAIIDELVTNGTVRADTSSFATNRLVIATAPGNPANVTSLEDFARPDPFLGLCAPQVPCGGLADRTLAAAGIQAEPDTREPDVRALLAKVESGELDAGLVYASDVLTAEAGVVAIELPADLPIVTSYPVAIATAASEPAGAQAFVEFLESVAARSILADHGFGPP